ncbi:hypothetical protein Syun_006838 [Stephania yunnanensis]|uniref:IMP dehydrogenase/GMP reductase domain-containing protein n=1 Tax=Stephania yunnanensis TaxID=152371 RepID=A0AAP0KX99_9MAGN
MRAQTGGRDGCASKLANSRFNQHNSIRDAANVVAKSDMLHLTFIGGLEYRSVSFSTKLTRNIDLSILYVASPIDTVSESSMAALGGIAIVHYNNTPSDQYSIICSAKSRRIPFASDPIFKSPSDFIDSGDDFAPPTFSSPETGTPSPSF